MATRYLAQEVARPVPQSEPLDARQVQNNAGGFVYGVGDWGQLQRFLVMGCEGGSYYASQRKMVRDNVGVLDRCVAMDGARVVAEARAISQAGRAMKNGPAILAIAKASLSPDVRVREAAFAAVPHVCRIGTHLFEFVADREALGGGWGRSMRRAMGQWFLGREAPDLALQVAKYAQREGWSMRDVLRLAHPKTLDAARGEVLRWAVTGELGSEALGPDADRAAHDFLEAVVRARTSSGRDLVRLIRDHKLPRECVPTEALLDPAVWEALLPHMGLEALVRNMGNLSKVGVLMPLSKTEQYVADRLSDEEAIRRSRLHPVRILIGLLTYKAGHGVRGKGTWGVAPRVVEALDGAFYKAFRNVEPSGRRIMIACDVSGSMGMQDLMGVPGLTPKVVGAALAMVTVKAEPRTFVTAFSRGLIPTDIGRCDSLASVIKHFEKFPYSATDCAAPMLYATANKLDVDTFAMWTDNESWCGQVHAPMALRHYRKQIGIDARFVVSAMTATNYSVADPDDPGSLTLVGFDADAPAILSEFAAGRA